MIIFDLIYNLSLLISLSVFSGFIDKKAGSTDKLSQVLQGLLFGVSTLLGMMYPYMMSEGIIFDGRTVMISICGLFFGPLSTAIAATIATLYRLMIGGSGWLMGTLTIVEAAAIGLAFYYLLKGKNRIPTNWQLFSMGFLVHTIMIILMLLLPSTVRKGTINTLAFSIFTIYPLATILIGRVLTAQHKFNLLFERLRESESNLKAYFDNAPDGIFIADSSKAFVDVNRAACEMTGYSRDELMNMITDNIVFPDDIQRGNKHFETVAGKGKASAELRYVRKDSGIGWFQINAVKIDDNRMLGFAKDITERKNIYSKIDDSLAKFLTIFELAPDAMIIYEVDSGVYIDANSAFCSLLGYTKDEIIGANSTDFNFFLNNESRAKLFDILINKGTLKNYELEILDRYGNVINALISASLVTFTNKKHIITIISDITEQKKNEREIQESELKYRSFIEKLPDGFYRSTPEGKFVYVNQAMVDILGYESSEELMNMDIINDLYFSPEERNPEENTYYTDYGSYEIYRVKKKDGSEIWIEDHSNYIKDENGNVLLHEGICRDISERLNYEKDKKELLLRTQKIASHLPGFIFQCKLSADGIYSLPYASEGINKLFGLKPQEVQDNIEKVMPILLPEEVDFIFSNIEKSSNTLTIMNFEFRVKHKSGKIIWVEVYATPEKSEDGTVIWHGYVSDIVERKKFEETLKENQASLNFAQEIAKMGSWEYNFEKDILKWSDNYFRLLGYEPGAFQPDMGFFLSRLYPEDYDFVLNIISNYSIEPSNGEIEFRIVMPDNSIKWIKNTYHPVFANGKLKMLRGVNIDITEMKYAFRNLNKLSRAIEQSPLTIVITDPDGIIEYVNPKFTEISGYQSDEVIGKKTNILKSDLMPNEFYERMWSTLISRKVWHSEIQNKKKSGELHWESIVIAPVTDEQNKIINYIALKEDISEKIRLMEELIGAKEKAEESDRLKSAFLANMSHEIRTPMNGIIGFSRMLSTPNLTDEELNEYVTVLNLSCNRLLNTVNDILDISKIDADQMELKLEYFTVNELLEELNGFYKDIFKNKGINFTIINKLSADYRFLGDEQRIYQILNNLLSNAEKFTNRGSVTMSCELDRENSLIFKIKDTGIGISSKAQNLIFGRFYQENTSLDRGYEGSGLGLAICKGLVEMMNGEISVNSIQGKGSEFILLLPSINQVHQNEYPSI
ncbi:MAG: PAS domain S-box protein [Candidatus Kapaibacterium sp.]